MRLSIDGTFVAKIKRLLALNRKRPLPLSQAESELINER